MSTQHNPPDPWHGILHMRAWLILLAGCGSELVTEPFGTAPFGALRVEWSIATTDGASLSCAEAGVDRVDVRIAGKSTEVSCANGVFVAEQLIEGPYPVIVALKVAGTEIASGRANADVVAGSETRVAVKIEVERRAINAGSFEVGWSIDGMPAAARCAEIGASTVEFATVDGSRTERMGAVPCVDAGFRLLEVEPGRYTLLLRAVRPDGTLVTSNKSAPFEVRTGQNTVVPNVTLVTAGAPPPGRIVALYTVNGSVAASQCDLIGGQGITIDVLQIDQVMGSRLERTNTASCGAGRIVADRLDTDLYSVELRLRYRGGLSVTSTVVRSVRVDRGRSSTVSVDLVTQ